MSKGGIMKKLCVCSITIWSVLFLLGSYTVCEAASNSEAAQFYKGKVVTLVLAHPPGAGFDEYARMIAPYLKKNLGSTVIIKNMPGGGGMYAYNYVYKSKPDGLTICMPSTDTMVMDAVMKSKGVQYDYRKFNWLGSIGRAMRTIIVANNSPFHELKDFEKAEKLKFGGSTKTNSSIVSLTLFAHAINFPPEKVSIVSGYGGGQEAMMSVIQGESDMTTLTDSTSARYQAGNLVRSFLVLDKERSKYLPNTPSYYEFIQPPEERSWPLEFYADLQKIRRGMITSPNVPKDRVAFLRDALNKCLQDKELITKAEKSTLPLDYLTGEQIQKQIEEKLSKITDAQFDEMKNIIINKYD